MPFTAGSVELAKATKLALQLSNLYQTYGASKMDGITAIHIIEKTARKLGFGVTGITTGAGFPPFGSVTGGAAIAALQNPRGETRANGINLGLNNGATVGVYMKKFVRSGEDYRAVTVVGATLAYATANTANGNTLGIRGAFNAFTNDQIVIDSATYIVSGGATSAAAGAISEVTVSPVLGAVYAVGTALNIQTVGVTRDTAGVAGTTFESYPRNTVVHAGFTAAVFFGGAAGSTGTVS
jgi:hypothetical protein